MKVNKNIEGVGPDTPTEVQSNGAKQSKLPYRFDLIDAKSQFRLAEILDQGAKKYGDQNWRGISIESNINHALAHITAYLAGDKQDDHLGHAYCRVMFALGRSLEDE